MSKKAFIILFAVVVSLLVVTFKNSEKTNNSYSQTTNKLLNFNIDSVNKIDFNSNTFNLSLEKKGPLWLITNKAKYQAKTSSVNNLLLTLSELSSSQIITQNKANHQRLGLDKDQALVVSLYGKNDKLESKLFVGRKREVKGEEMAETFVKTDKDDTVYLIAQDLGINKELSDWLKSEILSLPAEVINEISFLEGKKPFIIKSEDASKDKTTFVLSTLNKGDKQKDWEVNNLANMFANLTLNDVFLTDSFTPGKEGFVDLIEVETKAKRIWKFQGTEIDGEFFIKIFVDNTKVTEAEKNNEGKVLPLPNIDYSKWVFKLDSWLAGNFKKAYADLLEKKESTSTEDKPAKTIKEDTSSIDETTELKAEEEIKDKEIAPLPANENKKVKETDSTLNDPESAPIEPEL